MVKPMDSGRGLGACRAWGVEAKIGPSEDSFCQGRRLIAIAMGQEADEKWTAAVNLQPTLPKPDRLLGAKRSDTRRYREHLQRRHRPEDAVSRFDISGLAY